MVLVLIEGGIDKGMYIDHNTISTSTLIILFSIL